jgi:2,3-bisphosphoglycerate-dependent phosphoglycerate mutase
MSTLILLRHGQSLWNLKNRFTGEVDIDLSVQGEEEAKNAAKLLKDFHIDIAFVSMLNRAIRTLDILLAQMRLHIPIVKSAALNERNYGKLQGLNKAETEKTYGLEKVLLWRRSYETRPPGGESLEDTFKRVVPYYLKEIMPKLRKGKTVLVVAHGNSLRALMMYLENLSETEIESFNVATGVPKVYEFSPYLKLIKANYL